MDFVLYPRVEEKFDPNPDCLPVFVREAPHGVLKVSLPSPESSRKNEQRKMCKSDTGTRAFAFRTEGDVFGRKTIKYDRVEELEVMDGNVSGYKSAQLL